MMTKRLFDFSSFPPLFPFHGSFETSITGYLSAFAEKGQQSVWRICLIHRPDNFEIPLYITQESSVPGPPFCPLCSSAGWNDHFVSKRKYLLIIPADRKWNKPLNEDALDDKTHLLHGVIHCNGFGHLICINGKEGGSLNLRGREIMDLWDRLCTAFQVRKITVEDVSKKRGMDVKLLHEIAYGHSWFGRWGYRFSGGFETAEKYYDCAVEDLSTIRLDNIVHHSSDFKQIIDRYQHMSEGRLLTMRDLLRYMLTIRTVAYADKSPSTAKKFSELAREITSQWPQQRLEETAEAVVNVLKLKKDWVASYEELKDDLIMDTGLLNFVLSLLDDAIVGSYSVKCANNHDNEEFKFTLCKISGNQQGTDTKYYDVQIMYNEILRTFLLAPKVILRGKIFLKEWPVKEHGDRIICHVKSRQDESLQQTGEVVVVIPPSSTIGDLKRAAQMAIRDAYFSLERFVVTGIEGMEDKTDDETILCASQVVLRGFVAESPSASALAGSDERKLKGIWDTTEDDGETLVCTYCDMPLRCSVASDGAIYHTRCYHMLFGER